MSTFAIPVSALRDLEDANARVRIAVDYENNAETWWDNARTLARRESDYPPGVPRDLPESCAMLFTIDGRGNVDHVTVSVENADAFRRWAEQIEGWHGGPDHAPHPVMFNDDD